MAWQNSLLVLIKTFNEILTAGIAITAFALLLYALTFNLRDRVARSFALILACVVIVFTTDAIGSTEIEPWLVDLWLRMQWVGIILLPATYLHFSDAILATTGKVSRGRRRWAVRFSYVVGMIFLLTLPFGSFLGPVVIEGLPAPYLQPTPTTALFIILFVIALLISWYNLWRAYKRTRTSTSRRRMVYLIAGAFAPVLGSFPFLLFGSGFAALHQLVFWLIAFLSNLLVEALLVIMAYSVAFFGVSWPDRVVKARLFKWLMRGPITASIALGLVTIVRRVSESLGFGYSAVVPITMAASILLLEYLITLFAPTGEKFLFDGSDRGELELIRSLEDRLLTKNDLSQFLEMILAAICDRLQSPGGYLAARTVDGFEVVVKTGECHPDLRELNQEMDGLLSESELSQVFEWNNQSLVSLVNESLVDRPLLGFIILSRAGLHQPDDEQIQALKSLARRASLALQDRSTQQQVFQTLLELTPQVDLIQKMRAAGRYNEAVILNGDPSIQESEISQWVKDALTHYWGGPKLTDSPLTQLKIVQDQAMVHEGNTANSLRAVLREALERIKPEGERKYTTEWMLYNILEMKFMEGRKVRDIALRLAMSEADLYRKQRVAIESVAKVISEMELEARQNHQ